METEQSNRKDSRPKRPFGLLVIIFLQIVLIGILSADSVVQQTEFAQLLFLGNGIPYLGPQIEILGVVFVIVTTYGLWRLKNWAWMLLMIQLGASMAFNLWIYFNPDLAKATPAQFAIMVRDVILVFYLNHQEVRGLFQRTRQPSRGRVLREDTP